MVMTPSPIAWRPSVISPSPPIPRAMDVVGTIGNRDRDRAWISIPRISAITRPITSIIRSVARITSIIISASGSSESHKKQKEEESRPFRSLFHSSLGGDYLRLGVIDNI
jgi:hypothetical protein